MSSLTLSGEVDEMTTIRAELAELRAEVARLRTGSAPWHRHNPFVQKGINANVIGTFRGGERFSDTLGDFHPVVIDKTGDITINSSEDHKSSLRFNNTKYSAYADNDILISLGPNQEIVIQDTSLGSVGDEIGWLVLRGHFPGSSGALLVMENQGNSAGSSGLIRFSIRATEASTVIRGHLEYSADVASPATHDRVTLKMWDTAAGFDKESFIVIRAGAQVDFGARSDGRMTAAGDTRGFFYVPAFAGSPSGVPAEDAVGIAAMMYDKTNNKLFVYNSGWKSVTLA